MTENSKFQLSSFFLHILAMALMLCDHLWGTVIPGNNWLTCVGRLAFPIFAFMLVEGYFHTRSLKKYALRLLVFALVSEIPFNLAMGGSLFYPLHQNVLWTLLIALGLIRLNEMVKNKAFFLRILVGLATILLGYLIGLFTMVDYLYAGPLTALVFYFFRDRNWRSFLCQLICLWYINFEMLGGFGYELEIFGTNLFFPQQGFALLALVPIWLYHGKQGYHNKWLRYVYYGFYPVHLLILGLIKIL